MAKIDEYSTKDSVVVVYTGEGKGKTSAAIGLTARALGAGWQVAFVQFIKYWNVNEHKFLERIESVFKQKLQFYRGGRGFYNLGELSAKDVTSDEHKQAAQTTWEFAFDCATSGKYQLVVCDEINNAVHEGLIKKSQLKDLMLKKHAQTSLCLTGRDFPKEYLKQADIATNMTKLRHHFDDKFLANEGIDY